MKNKVLLFTVAVSFIIYLSTSTINYKYDYKTQEIEDDIKEYKQKIDEFLVEQRINLSREKAVAEYNLKLNNNWYYLKDDNGEEEK